jgi:hypothetical protein
MYDIKNNTENLIAKIYEYQKHIGLSRKFIRELSAEGADTRNLEEEILELERKINDLKLTCGYPLI